MTTTPGPEPARALAAALGAWWLTRAVFSCLILPATGAGLGDTEAYYTAWSMDLAVGYHDHPAAVALALALTRTLTHGVAGTRLMPALALGATAALWAWTWRRASSPRAAAWGFAAFAAAPIYATGGLLAAPDAPLALAWAAAVALALHARQRPEAWWGVAAAAAAMTASKLTGAVFAAALAVEAARARPRYALRVLLGAALGLLPALLFELQHDATGLRYHLLERHTGAPFAPANWLALLGGQLLAFSPLLLIFLAVELWRARALLRADAAEGSLLRLALMTWGPLALTCAFTREAEPHWPVLGALPALGLLAGRGADAGPRRWLAALALGALLQAGAWLHLATPLFVAAAPDTYEPRFDLANDLLGWDRVADEARRHLDEGRVERVVSYHYTMCGQLAAALDDLDAVACPSPRRDAFDFLQGGHAAAPAPGERVLFVRDNRYDEPGPRRLRCRAWGEERFIEVERGGRVVRRFGLQTCEGFLGIAPDAPR